jgi:hypothetical protein
MSVLRQIGRYFDLLSTQREHDGENVILLAVMRCLDGQEREERVIVKRRDIQTTCDAFADRDDVVEVWVYQKIFHNLKEPKADEVLTDESVVLANAALGVLKR